MEANLLQIPSLYSKSSPSSFIRHLPSHPHRLRSLRLTPINCSGSSDAPPPVPPPETLEIKFRRGSRRRMKQPQQQDKVADGAATSPPPPAKDWNEKSIAEKAMELYMGEKGFLFWVNKFAYASIFIVIGAWILFRFVGPALNLYQLDSAPLSPSSMFKAS